MINSIYNGIRDVTQRIVAFFLLILSLPHLILISLLIMNDTSGPIIFTQIRVGKRKKLFKFYKFRTMWVDAKQRFPQLYSYKYKDTVGSVRFKILDDPRLTRFGKKLRRTSLDELPNLINVIKGEMSLVGPRPEIPEMLKYYKKSQLLKFSVKPGITGYAQTSGRGFLTFQETIKYDLKYAREKSFLTDLKILFKTVKVVIKGIGAF